ncbi:hypothetical protein HMPREF1979_00327 [Actinomyces johnsonii F0542]|uniref:Secreted protein n=1 Tax=Actinomyces johnsonii F0542 TaxID=1321818 RepID=U1QVX3_9ACTO|nr:hypothetical protein HMPREF1979_00327 [Actinomyces johnsonii F0542]
MAITRWRGYSCILVLRFQSTFASFASSVTAMKPILLSRSRRSSCRWLHPSKRRGDAIPFNPILVTSTFR